MKLLSRFLSLALLATAATAYIGCGPDPKPQPPIEEPTEQEIVTEQLTSDGGTWAPGSITVDGTDVTEEFFTGFSITFKENNTFTTAGGTALWEAQDTWNFADAEDADVLERGADDKTITIESISDTQLVFSIEWDQTTHAPGRTKSIPGSYEFTLVKQ